MDVMHRFFSECCALQDAQVRTKAFIILMKWRFPGTMSSELNQPNVVEDLADVWQKFETADRRADEFKKRSVIENCDNGSGWINALATYSSNMASMPLKEMVMD